MDFTMNLLDQTDTPEIEDLIAAQTGRLAFDVGSCAGRTANIMAAHFEQVVACEPSPFTFDLLRENAAPNVTPLNVAVSNDLGTITLATREFTEARGYLFTGDSLPEWGDATGTVTVASVTLDSLTRQYGHPDFVKIDTEGHEIAVVEGGAMTLMGLSHWVVEIHSEVNGELLHSMLGGRVVRHALHPPGSYRWRNHYWLVNP